MNDNKLQKRLPPAIMEKGQYVLFFVLIASMLVVANFPMFVVFFFAVFAYFLWKIFSSASRNETREIFEFYLSANDILRDDERRWYGFEMKEVVARGERIVQGMSAAPPLVYFALGALYNKIGDHKAAVSHLGYVVENDSSDERAFVYPSPELRNYVRILRRIEREPGEAPLTSSAIRALERARKNRGKAILEQSRENLHHVDAAVDASATEAGHQLKGGQVMDFLRDPEPREAKYTDIAGTDPARRDSGKHEKSKRNDNENPFTDRKPITEVLHDIYDQNVQ